MAGAHNNKMCCACACACARRWLSLLAVPPSAAAAADETRGGVRVVRHKTGLPPSGIARAPHLAVSLRFAPGHPAPNPLVPLLRQARSLSPHTHTHTRAHTHAHAHIHTHIHKHAHTQTHTHSGHTHTRTSTLSLKWSRTHSLTHSFTPALARVLLPTRRATAPRSSGAASCAWPRGW